MSKRDMRQFDPDEFAKLDADMWVAYYHHHFFRLFLLLLRLNYTHFRPSVMLTAMGAYHSAQAAIIFRKTKGNEDSKRVLVHLAKFYKLLSDQNIQPFNYIKAAELELEWWMVDRYPSRYKTSRATALAECMAVVYEVEPPVLAEYGKKRAAAMELLGDFHHDTKAKVDWQKLQKFLQESYSALHRAVQ